MKFKAIRLTLSVVAKYNLEIEQLDYKTTFLHGELDEMIYMQQPEGFIDKYNEHVFCLRSHCMD